MSWDFGVTPYQPMPYQWMKRLKGIMEANEKWGLCGLMESHHYGFWPSFISEFTGKALEADGLTMEEKLAAVLEQFYGAENRETVDQALKLWSEAITHYIPSNGDQYCAFRVGPSYPFNLFTEIKMIAADHAHFGAGIMFPKYYDYVNGQRSLSAVSRKAEIASLKQMKELMEQGLALLKSIPAEQVNEELEYLINLGEFISCMVTTGIHSKQWFTMAQNMNANEDKEAVKKMLDEMEVLLKAEIANAEKAIPLVERDSRLGWEPSMEYLGDAEHIRWKIRQVNYVLEHEIPAYRKAAEF